MGSILLLAQSLLRVSGQSVFLAWRTTSVPVWKDGQDQGRPVTEGSLDEIPSQP